MSLIPKKPSFRLKSPVPLEHQEQAALFSWARVAERTHPELKFLHSSQNGMAATSIQEALRAKKAGMKPGVPDIFLPVPRGGYHGLFIELKRKTGTTSDLSSEQKRWLDAMNGHGYRAVMCAGWEAARAVIEEYLK